MSAHRLDVHVQKGMSDGLYISSVGCAGDLWAVIMDAGTGFSAQQYKVVPSAFLPKEWIMEKWDQGYYITAVAGQHGLPPPSPPAPPGVLTAVRSLSVSTDCWLATAPFSPAVLAGLPARFLCARFLQCRVLALVQASESSHPVVAGASDFSSLVVMSKGTKFTQQSYKVADTFPFEWIKKKWKEGFHITSLATGGGEKNPQWAVVMSRSAGFQDQCIELDFQYPSEGIHRRWDAGACFAMWRIRSSPQQPELMQTAERTALVAPG